jgi:hypothetical protein
MVAPEDAMGPETVNERRAGRRRRMLKHVQVLSLDKKATSAVDLTLRNTSAFGAQLFGPAESLARIPDEFYLVAPGQLRMIRCRIVWKGDDMVGRDRRFVLHVQRFGVRPACRRAFQGDLLDARLGRLEEPLAVLSASRRAHRW